MILIFHALVSFSINIANSVRFAIVQRTDIDPLWILKMATIFKIPAMKQVGVAMEPLSCRPSTIIVCFLSFHQECSVICILIEFWTKVCTLPSCSIIIHTCSMHSVILPPNINSRYWFLESTFNNYCQFADKTSFCPARKPWPKYDERI